MDSDFNLKLIVFLIIIIPICLLWVFLFFLFRWIERVERKSTIIHGHIVNIDKWTVHGGTQRARAQLELADGTISDVDVGFWHKKGDSLRLHHYNDKYYGHLYKLQVL